MSQLRTFRTNTTPLTWPEFLAVLKRMRESVAAGRKSWHVDDCTPGCKHMEVSWGMCTQDPEFWDSSELTWPDRGPLDSGLIVGGNRVLSVSPRRRRGDQRCPFDRRAWEPAENFTGGQMMSGCFYTCMFFNNAKEGTGKRRKRKPPPGRQAALGLYDKMIERVGSRADLKEAPSGE